MNERIKLLRQELKLSGEKFGDKIGLTRMSISNIENGSRGITEQTIKSICREFNVNEDWLRYGKGNKFKDNSINKIFAELDTKEIEILQKYVALDRDVRKNFIEIIIKLNIKEIEILQKYVTLDQDVRKNFIENLFG